MWTHRCTPGVLVYDAKVIKSYSITFVSNMATLVAYGWAGAMFAQGRGSELSVTDGPTDPQSAA